MSAGAWEPEKQRRVGTLNSSHHHRHRHRHHHRDGGWMGDNHWVIVGLWIAKYVQLHLHRRYDDILYTSHNHRCPLQRVLLLFLKDYVHGIHNTNIDYSHCSDGIWHTPHCDVCQNENTGHDQQTGPVSTGFHYDIDHSCQLSVGATHRLV